MQLASRTMFSFIVTLLISHQTNFYENAKDEKKKVSIQILQVIPLISE